MGVPLARLNIVRDTLANNMGLSGVAELDDAAIGLGLAGFGTEVLEIVVASNDAGNGAIGGLGWAALGCEEDAHLILGCKIRQSDVRKDTRYHSRISGRGSA